MRPFKTLTALALALVAAALATSVAAEPVKIRIHWAVVPGHLAPLIAKAPAHVQPHYGKSYVVEPIFMAGSGPGSRPWPLANSSCRASSPQALVLGTVEGKLDLKVIGQQVSTEVPGYASNGFWVRKDSGINKIADLKGKKIGVNARGSSIDAAVKTMLTRHGLKDGDDYQMVEVRFPAQLPALEAKRIDLAALLQPFGYMAEAKGTYKQLFSIGDALGPSETVTWIGRADWIKENRAALVDFLEDNIRFRKWATDPKTRPEAIKVLAEVAKRKPEVYADWAFTKRDSYRDPQCLVNVARYQKNVDDLVKLGLLPKRIDVSEKIDNSLAEEAAKRFTTH